MRARESSGSDVVSLRGSQTCWDVEMRPGYRLTTGQLQVSRPVLWLGLKNKLSVWRVCTLEKGVQMGYRQSHFLWYSIHPHQPSVITQQRPWDELLGCVVSFAGKKSPLFNVNTSNRSQVNAANPHVAKSAWGNCCLRKWDCSLIQIC